MLALIACVLANVLLFICFKMFFRTGIQSFVAIVINYWVCLVLGSLMVGHIPVVSYGLETQWVPFGLLLGLIFIIGFNIAALSVKYAGMSVTTIMQKMSLIMSAGFALVMFREHAGTLKVTGIVIAVIAIFLVNKPRNKLVNIENPKALLLYPVLTLVFSGLIEIILYYVQAKELTMNADAELTTFAFSIAAILGGLVIAWQYLQGSIIFQWKDYIGGVALGIPNFFSIYLILIALGTGIEGSVLFPALNISIMVATTLVGVFVFREKLGPINILGLVAAAASILLIMSR